LSSKNAPPGAFFFHRHILTGQASRTDTAAWAALAARYGPWAGPCRTARRRTGRGPTGRPSPAGPPPIRSPGGYGAGPGSPWVSSTAPASTGWLRPVTRPITRSSTRKNTTKPQMYTMVPAASRTAAIRAGTRAGRAGTEPGRSGGSAACRGRARAMTSAARICTPHSSTRPGGCRSSPAPPPPG